MRLKGLGVSPGVGIGRALVLKRGAHLRFRVPDSLVARELERLDAARDAVARTASSRSRRAWRTPRAANTPTSSTRSC